jgi:ribonuclease BN (tRNA processing enzyme)
MKITFLGSGSFFAGDNYHSNLLLETDSNSRLLIDCGTDIRHSLKEAGYTTEQVDAIYVSHLHGDHAGGLEYMGFANYFSPKAQGKQDLFIHQSMLEPLWNGVLSESMRRAITDKTSDLSTYFRYRVIKTSFTFDYIKFNLVPALHVVNNTLGHVISYGLNFTLNGVKVFFTSDVSLADKAIDASDFDMAAYWKNYEDADLIFHDCETINTSEVHAHYDFLNETLQAPIKKKTWLYHTQQSAQPDAVKDGFLGIVEKGQIFQF